MARHAWWVLIVLVAAGCVERTATKTKKKLSTTTNPAGQGEPVKEVKVAEPEAKPPPQTFKPAIDEDLAALKDVATDDLIGRLGDEQQRSLASRALAQRGKDAVEPLQKVLEADDAQARAAAAFTLGQLGADAAAATDALKKVAESDESEIARDAAAFALDAIEGN